MRAFADRQPGRLHVPGHKGGAGADPGLRAALGWAALTADIPQDIEGIDLGPDKGVGIWLALAGSVLMVVGAVLAYARISLAVESREP